MKNQRKYRIAVLGIGGVGGFIGGKLAAAYAHDEEVELIFIARGSNAAMIKKAGLTLITPSGEIVAVPDMLVEEGNAIGEIDLLLCCTKSYDLENSIRSLSSSLTANSIVIPLLNGVDASERIRAVLPEVRVLQACIYIVSKRVAPGVVQQSGDFHALHFGGDELTHKERVHLQGLFDTSGINVVYEQNIREKIWSKFSFISPVATYTSAYDVTIGAILESDTHTAALTRLMTELGTLAHKLNIDLPADFIENNFGVMRKLPSSATSSMQADFSNGRATELETLTGVVVQKAAAQSLQLEAYANLYQLLRNR